MRQNRQNGPHLTILSQRQSRSHSATHFQDKKFLSTTVGEGLSKQALDQRHQWLAHGASNRSASWALAPNSVGAAAIRHGRYSNLALDFQPNLLSSISIQSAIQGSSNKKKPQLHRLPYPSWSKPGRETLDAGRSQAACSSWLAKPTSGVYWASLGSLPWTGCSVIWIRSL